MKGHSIDEEWNWLIQDSPDGTRNIVGIVYPNDDKIMAVDMPPRQWDAYLKAGGLQADSLGRLSIRRSS